MSLKSRIHGYTVDRLKGIIQGINDTCGGSLSRTGKKQDLVSKIVALFSTWEGNADSVSLVRARHLLDHMDENGS